MANKINFSVGFNVDKSGLNTLKSELQGIQNLSVKDLIKTDGISDATGKLKDAQQAAKQLEDALEKAYNPKLGTVNLDKFNQEINKTAGGLGTVQHKFNAIGTQGAAAFRNITTQLLTTNKNLKESSQWLDKMANTMANTVRWSVASSALNAMTGSIQQAYGFAKNLDTSLNDIRIVTEKSADDMAKFAVQANKAAKALGQSTKAYADASLIYYQQGLSDTEAQARASTTLKAANVTGQNAAAVSEQLTAVWNGYKVSAQEAELYVDKLAAVAASTAADLEELSTGMSRVASAANIMGVDIDQLNAQLATIVSVTREAPESVGTALKTVYARMSDIEAGLDTETTLGEYTSQMNAMGISALDASGNLRDMGDVVEEIGNKWSTLTREQQTSLAQTIAGTRQYSRMMALFDNWDMYTKAMQTSANAAGTLQKQQDIYMESTEAHLAQLSAQAEELYTTLFDSEGINDVIDALTELVGVVDNVVKGLGGGAGLLRNLGAIGMHVFQNQITKGLTQTIRNGQGVVDNMKQQVALQKILNELNIPKNKENQTARQKEIVDITTKIINNTKILSEEEYNAAMEMVKQLNIQYDKEDSLKRQKKLLQDIVTVYSNVEDFSIDENGDVSGTLDGEKATLEDITNELKNQKKEWNSIIDEIKSAKANISDIEKNQSGKTASNRSVGQLQRWLNAYQEEYEQASYHLQGYKNAAQNSSTLSPEQEAQSQTYIVSQEKYLADLQAKIDAQIQRIQIASGNTNKYEQQIAEGYKKLGEEAKSLKDNLEKIEATVKDMDDPEAQEALKVIQDGLKTLNDECEVTDDNFEKVAAAVQASNKLIGKAGDACEEAAKDVKKLSGEQQENTKNIKENEGALKSWLKKLELSKNIENVTQTISGLSNAVNGLQQIWELGDIWSNEDMTAGEKFTATLTALTMAFTSLKFAYSDIKAAGPGLAKLWQTLTNTTAWNTVTQEINNEAHEEGADVKREEAAATDNLNDEVKENSADNITNSATENIPDGKGKGLKGKIKGTFGKLKGKMGAGGNLGIFAGVGGGIIGGAAVIAATAAIANAYYNSANKTAEQATKSATKLKEVYRETQDELDQLNSSLENYNKNLETLEGLTQGTIEYQQALHSVNSEVLELLKKYPELAEHIDNVNGVLQISAEGQDAITQAQINEVNAAYGASINAEMFAMQANYNKKLQDSRNEIDMTNTGSIWKGIGKTAGGAGAAAGIGAAIGAIGGPAGAAIGAIIGGIIGAIGTPIAEGVAANDAGAAFEDQIRDDVLEDALKLYQTNSAAFENVEELQKALTNASEAEISALVENSGKISELSAEMASLNATLDLYAQQLGAQLLNSAGYSSDYQYYNALSQLVGNEMSEEAKRLYEEKYKDKGKLGGGITDADIQAEYAKAMGYVNYRNKGDNKGEYTKEDGTTVIIDDDVARRYLAQQEAQKNSKTKIGQLNSLLTGSLANFSKNTNIQSAISDLAGGKISADFTSLTQTELSILTKDQVTEALRIALGFDSIDNAWKAIEASVKDSEKKRKEALEQAGFGDQLDSFNELSTNTILYFTDIYNQISGASQNAFINIINGIGENKNKFLTELESFDWTSENAIDDFNTLLTSVGISVREGITQEDIDRFKAAMFQIKNALPTVDELQQSISDLQKLASLHIGDVIDKDTYKAYVDEYGQELIDGYFTPMADGTALLTKSANEFFDSALNQKREVAKTASLGAIETYVNETEKQNKIDNWQGKSYSANKVTGDSKNERDSFIDYLDYGISIEAITPDEKVVLLSEFDSLHETRSTEWAQWAGQSSNASVKSGVGGSTTGSKGHDNQDVREQRLYNLFTILGRQDIADYYWEHWKLLPEHLQVLLNAESDPRFSSYKITTNNRDSAREDNAVTEFLIEYTVNPQTTYGADVLQDSNGVLQKIANQKANFDLTDLEEDLYFEASLYNNSDTLDELATTWTNEGLDKEIADKIINARKKTLELINPENYESLEANFNLSKIDKDLQKLKKDLEDINELTGSALIQNLQKQLDLYDAQIVALNKQKALKTTQLSETQNLLKEQYGSSIVENNGVIDLDASLAAIKTSIENNVGLATPEAKKAAFESAKTMLEQWGALYYETIPGLEDQITEAQDAQIQLLEDQYIAALNRITEELDKQLGYYNAINDVHQSMIDMADIFGESYTELGTRFSSIVANNTASINLAGQALAEAAENFDDAIADGFDEEAFEVYNSSLSTLLEEIQNQAEAIQAQYENTLNSIFNIENLERMNLEWESMKENSEKYLDNINAAYSIQKMERDILKDIESYSSEKIQQRMNKFRQEEMQLLREKDKLTQYDLDRAQARYDILKAQIALEEARENKTSMQLRMGADGSYSYQYVANEQDIQEKEAALAEAENKEYNLIKDAYTSSVDDVMGIWSEWQEKAAQAPDRATLESINEIYSTKLQAALEENKNAMADLEGTGIETSDLQSVINGMNTNLSGQLLSAFDAKVEEENKLQQWQDNINSALRDLQEFTNNKLPDTQQHIVNIDKTVNRIVELLEKESLGVSYIGTGVETGDGEAFGFYSNKTGELMGEAWAPYYLQSQEQREYFIEQALSKWDYTKHGSKPSEEELLDLLERYIGPTTLATGGYTGEWDSSGKLAVLHEKELVLNQVDTSNILSAVALVRSISSVLEGLNANRVAALSNVSAAVPAINSAQPTTPLQQEVKIEAVFPNVNVAAEVEEAFNDILNLAVQYANGENI